MRAHRGFTMVEAMTVIGIIAIVAALAIPMLRAARGNARLSSGAFEVSMWLDGLRGRALRDQEDLVAVIVDVPGNDPGPCAHGDDRACARYFLVRPQAGFVLNAINADVGGFLGASGTFPNAELVSEGLLPPGLRFHRRADGLRAPPPFGGIAAFDPTLVGMCATRSCIGIRFGGDGEVSPELPAGGTDPVKTGVAFGLGTDLADQTRGADQRGIVVSFPTGVVKSYPLPP